VASIFLELFTVSNAMVRNLLGVVVGLCCVDVGRAVDDFGLETLFGVVIAVDNKNGSKVWKSCLP
jgi:hypothetical protein